MNIIEQIDAEIAALKKRKQHIQLNCSHPDKTSINKGSSGNAMVGREAQAWTEHTCNLCGLQWTTDQNKNTGYEVK